MDLPNVVTLRVARSRADLAGLGGGSVPLAGGSWLFSEPQVATTELVDLTGLAWPPFRVQPEGLSVAATCTLAELANYRGPAAWTAQALFAQACRALFGSFKVWNVATVGGNLCISLPAGPMISLAAGLDADVVIWRADGSDSRMPAVGFVSGVRKNQLGPGDVLRSVEFPVRSLTATAVLRQIALSPLGRSAALLIGRADSDGTFVVTVTAATTRPVQVRYPSLPSARHLAADVGAIDAWFTDAHGSADWRRAMSLLLAEQIRTELAERTGRRR